MVTTYAPLDTSGTVFSWWRKGHCSSCLLSYEDPENPEEAKELHLEGQSPREEKNHTSGSNRAENMLWDLHKSPVDTSAQHWCMRKLPEVMKGTTEMEWSHQGRPAEAGVPISYSGRHQLESPWMVSIERLILSNKTLQRLNSCIPCGGTSNIYTVVEKYTVPTKVRLTMPIL